MQVDGHDIGVCSWSLRPSGLAELTSLIQELGLSHVQLALAPLLFLDDKPKHQELGHLRASGLHLTGAMISFPGEDYSTIAAIRATGGIAPDDAWPLRKQMVINAGKLARELQVKLLTFHVGFVPPSNHQDYGKMIARVGEVAVALQELGIELSMETGQESASELLQFLNDLPTRNVSINFDPANMILYGAGDPIQAIHTLSRHIRHVHVKDATASKKPGLEWGVEVPFGQGQVNVEAFLAALRDVKYKGPLVIEREAGSDRMADIRTAIATLTEA